MTDHHPASPGVSGAHPPSSAAIVHGWFDLSSPPETAGLVEATDNAEWTTVRGPGFEVALERQRVRWCKRDDQVVFMVTSGETARTDSRFAEVVLDMRTRRASLQTDRFGVVPLCYRVAEGRLSFSDRADTVPGLPHNDLDLQAIYDYLYFHVIAANRTIYRGVNRVAAAERVDVDIDSISRYRHWTPSFNFDRGIDFETKKKRFLDLLHAAVVQEIGNGEVGTFLSGGTDSSTVTGMLRRVAGRRIPTFSIGFEAEGYDEMTYARIAAKHFEVEHHEHYLTPDDLIDHIPAVAAHYDQPFGNSSALPAYCCARLARAHGLSRVLAGDGGDELFGGNLRYAKQKVFAGYERLPEGLRRRVLEPLLSENSLARTIPVVKKLASYVDQARIPMPDRTETYNLLERFGAECVVTPDLLARVDQTAGLALQRSVYAESDGADLVNRMLAFDWRFTLADTDLPKVVGTTSLAGLDVGFPMLDDALVDFSLSLSPSDKVRGLKLRWFFKEALRDFLPQEIIRKSKHGFGLPFGPWLVKHERLHRFAETALRQLVERNVVARPLVDDLFSVHLQEHPGYYGEMIWILMMLEHWIAARVPAFSVDHV